MKKLATLLFTVFLFTGKAVSGTECGLKLTDRYASFVFVEVNEAIEVGSLLASYPTANVSSVDKHYDSVSSIYVDPTFNSKTQEIEFYLIKNLSDYRQDPWLASLEIHFDVNCDSSLKTYIFMVLIKDENLYAPKYLNAEPSQEFNISLPWPMKTKINTVPIRVQDMDYNRNYANCNISCKGEDCQYFNVTIELMDNQDAIGYIYDVNIFFNDEVDYGSLLDIPEGHIFSISLIVGDSVFISEELNVDLRVSQITLPKKSKFPVLAVAGGVSAIAIICTLLAIGFGYQTMQNRAAKNILRKLTRAEIREFLEGTVENTLCE